MNKKLELLKILSLAYIILILGACSSDKNNQPNILLIVSEDNGPDLGCYGVDAVTTPNLDKLAAEGILFENAFVTYSVCSPSRGTIYTGLYPHQNGQIGLATHNFRMYESFKTLPVYMKEAGYRTGCIGKIHVNPESSIPWDFRPGGRLNGSNFAKLNMPAYAAEADTFIRAGDEPFFLMVNYPDAHYPVQRDVEGLPTIKVDPEDLDSPLPFIGADSERLREFTANYYNCMNRLDESIGMLLAKLEQTGKAKNTIIIYLGDHGAQFSRGKCSNYEGGLEVPFIIHWPGNMKEGQRRPELISTVDIVPTMCKLAGLDIPESLPGLDLTDFFSGEDPETWREYAFAGGIGSAAQFYFPRRSVRDGRYKLILNLESGTRENPHAQIYEVHQNPHFLGGTVRETIQNSTEEIQGTYQRWRNPPKYELYDLENDPFELNDLSTDPNYKDPLDRLTSTLTKWQKETNDPLLDPGKLKLLREEFDKNLGAPSKNIVWGYPDYFFEN